MNSTLKSLLFWMVLIVVGVMIWQFSTFAQRSENPMQFSVFLQHLEKNEIQSVTMTGNEITGVLTTAVSGDGTSKFKTYAPPQFEARRRAAAQMALSCAPTERRPTAR